MSMRYQRMGQLVPRVRFMCLGVAGSWGVWRHGVGRVGVGESSLAENLSTSLPEELVLCSITSWSNGLLRPSTFLRWWMEWIYHRGDHGWWVNIRCENFVEFVHLPLYRLLAFWILVFICRKRHSSITFKDRFRAGIFPTTTLLYNGLHYGRKKYISSTV